MTVPSGGATHNAEDPFKNGMSVRLVLINLGIAAAYLALGLLGLKLALPPGYSTAVWPPAGLALGACLVWGGWRVGAGIFLGSLATNSLVSGHFAPDLPALAIAAGSTLQAVAGDKLLRLIDPGLGLDSPGRVIRFTAVVALDCLIASSIGNLALYLNHAIAEAQLLQSFVTWWAGDALGMQIFTPLTLLAVDRREIWRGRRLAVGLPLVLAFLLCVLVYGYVRRQEQEQIEARFDQRAEQILVPLSAVGEQQVRSLDSLVSLFRASQEVSPEEFRIFAGRILQAGTGFRALEWAPLLQPGQEQAWRDATRRLLGRELTIVPVPGADVVKQSEQAPVTYIEPLQGNESALGLDLLSERIRGEAIARAERAEVAVVSSKFVLMQDPSGPGAVLLVQAVRDGIGNISGFCIAAIDLGTIREVFKAHGELRWQLVDRSDPAVPLLGEALQAPMPGGSRVFLDRRGIYYRRPLPMADRQWELTLFAPASALAPAGFSPSLLILFFAFSTCGALGNLALTTTGERRRVDDEVRTKTRALSAEVEQRQQLERELREKEQRYRRALDTAQLGSWTFDPETRTYAVDRWSRLHLGVERDTLAADELMAILHEEDRQALRQKWLDYQRHPRQAAVDRYELRVPDAQGKSRILEITAEPAYEPTPGGQRVRSLTGTSRDITDRRQAEELQRIAREAAEAAVRTRSEFVANMSHELRTPMNGILGMVALALGTRLSLQQREYLLLVQESAQSLLRLLNDILDFSKMDAGKLELESAEFDVRDLFGATLQRMAEAAQGKGLGLHLRIAAAVPRALRGDPQRLMQVLINLVSNATKFTAAGEIVVAVEAGRAEGGRLELLVSVRDTGSGIAPLAQQKIFEPFAQADSSITRQFGGTGLGLSICRQIVDLFHGRMWLESEAGRGSTFHFSAWLEPGAESPSSVGAGERLRGRRALVLTDTQTCGRIVDEWLRGWQVQGVICPEPDRAVAIAAPLAEGAAEPFLFIVDLHAGGVFAGEEVARRMRDRYGSKVRIIGLVTAVEPPDAAIRCFQAGIDETVLIPIREAELLRALLSPAESVDEDDTTSRAGAAGLPPVSLPLQILVAEDNPINQKIAVALLESRGHVVTLAENGRQAVELYQQQPFDLILMDVQMPELDGLAATRRIRELEAGQERHVRIVAVTASAHAGERERILAAGTDGYLAKPYSLPGLVEVVEVPLASDAAGQAPRVPLRDTALPAGPCFDRAEALARCLNNPALLQKIIDTFQSTQAQLRQELRAAIERDDRLAVEHWAHRLKGGSATISAKPAAAAAEALESAARLGDRPLLPALMDELDARIERLLTELASA